MTFYELLVLLGVDPKVARWKAYLWFWGGMFVGAVAMLANTFAGFIFLSEELLVFVLVPWFVAFYVSGRIFGILESGKNREGLKDLARFFMGMLMFRINREHVSEKFVLWLFGVFTVVTFLTFLLFVVLISGGSPVWTLLFFPLMFLFYVLGRYFGVYK